MKKEHKNKIDDLNSKIIQAEIDKVRYPHNRQEYNDAIKENYSGISQIKKESEEESKQVNVALVSAAVIIGLFLFVFTINQSINSKDAEITGFTTYNVKEVITESDKLATQPTDSAVPVPLQKEPINLTEKKTIEKEVANGK